MTKRPVFLNCVALLALSACTSGTCPLGSQSVGNQCVSLDECPAGQERRNGECVMSDDMPAMGGDASHSVGGAGGSGSKAQAGTGALMAGSAAPDTGIDDPVLPVDGGEPDACASIDCGAHGVCEVDLSGVAHCACDVGFVGDVCDACVAGLGLSDEGGCVPLCDAADAIDCGPFGTCLADDSGASCTCMHPHAGASCESCADGYALEDGQCVPDCGECGLHEFCDETLHVPSCACVAGYADGANGCAWVGDGSTGGIVDGEFDDANAWTAKDVTIRDGQAILGSQGTGDACTVGTLSQTLTMPERVDAEPFVLDMQLQTLCADTNLDNCPALLLEVGNSVRRVRAGGTLTGQTVSICLGAAAYGRDVPLRIRPSIATASSTRSCDATTWPWILFPPHPRGECERVPSAGPGVERRFRDVHGVVDDQQCDYCRRQTQLCRRSIGDHSNRIRTHLRQPRSRAPLHEERQHRNRPVGRPGLDHFARRLFKPRNPMLARLRSRCHPRGYLQRHPGHPDQQPETRQRPKVRRWSVRCWIRSSHQHRFVVEHLWCTRLGRGCCTGSRRRGGSKPPTATQLQGLARSSKPPEGSNARAAFELWRRTGTWPTPLAALYSSVSVPHFSLTSTVRHGRRRAIASPVGLKANCSRFNWLHRVASRPRPLAIARLDRRRRADSQRDLPLSSGEAKRASPLSNHHRLASKAAAGSALRVQAPAEMCWSVAPSAKAHRASAALAAAAALTGFWPYADGARAVIFVIVTTLASFIAPGPAFELTCKRKAYWSAMTQGAARPPTL